MLVDLCVGLLAGKAMAKYKGTEWEFILGIDAIAYQRDAYLTKAMLENIFGALFLSLFHHLPPAF